MKGDGITSEQSGKCSCQSMMDKRGSIDQIIGDQIIFTF